MTKREQVDYAKGWHAGTEAASVLALKNSERYLENSISRNVLEAVGHGIYAMVMPKPPEQPSAPPTSAPLKSGMTWLVSETSYGKVTGWRHFQDLDEALKMAVTWVSQSAGDVTIARRDVSDKSPTNPLGIPAINYRGTHMIITDREGNAVTQVAQMTAHSTYTFGLPQALIDALSEYDIIPLEDWI